MASEDDDSGLLWLVVLIALFVHCDRIERLEKQSQSQEQTAEEEGR